MPITPPRIDQHARLLQPSPPKTSDEPEKLIQTAIERQMAQAIPMVSFQRLGVVGIVISSERPAQAGDCVRSLRIQYSQ